MVVIVFSQLAAICRLPRSCSCVRKFPPRALTRRSQRRTSSTERQHSGNIGIYYPNVVYGIKSCAEYVLYKKWLITHFAGNSFQFGPGSSSRAGHGTMPRSRSYFRSTDILWTTSDKFLAFIHRQPFSHSIEFELRPSRLPRQTP